MAVVEVRKSLSVRDFQGKSTDVKPTSDIATGSTFYEVDTGNVWLFDELNVNPVTSNGWWEV